MRDAAGEAMTEDAAVSLVVVLILSVVYTLYTILSVVVYLYEESFWKMDGWLFILC